MSRPRPCGRLAVALVRHRFALAALLLTVTPSAAQDEAPSSDLTLPAIVEPAAPSTEEELILRIKTLRARANAARQRRVLVARAYVKQLRAGLWPLTSGLESWLAYVGNLEKLQRLLRRTKEEEAQVTTSLAQTQAQLLEREALSAEARSALERAEHAIASAEERERAYRQAFDGEWQPNQRVVYGAQEPEPAERHASFSSQKGRLPLPVAGRTEVRKVLSPLDHGHALSMLVGPGAPVRAVFGGRVAFVGQYPKLGLTVIVDHGEGYATVTSELASATVAVGETLGAGAPVGNAQPAKGRARVLLELQHQGQPLDPSEWYGL